MLGTFFSTQYALGVNTAPCEHLGQAMERSVSSSYFRCHQTMKRKDNFSLSQRNQARLGVKTVRD